MTSARPAPEAIQVIPVPGLPEVRPGDDLAGLIAGAALVTSLLLVGLVYLVLARAKRVFEEAESESGTEFAT